MTEETIWGISALTQFKHELLKNYLKAWFPILAQSRNRRIIFLDGFAGPGIYQGGEPGSPIIALKTLIKHSVFPQSEQTEFIFIFVEKDKERFSILENEVKKFWEKQTNGQPDNVIIKTLNASLKKTATEIICELNKQKNQQAPIFAFLDPFGWSDLSMNLIGKLVAANKGEVLINFMYDKVNRFVTDKRPAIAKTFTELFGICGDELKKARGLAPQERKMYLLPLYKNQLKEKCGFKFVCHFEIYSTKKNRTAYFLIFGTRHKKGLQVMKNEMWKIDPEKGTRSPGSTKGQPVLFKLEPDYAELRKMLLERFSSAKAPIKQLIDFTIEETPYIKKHLTTVLKQLEYEKKIECSDRKNQKTYPPGTQICFLGDN